ncbi:MAG: hypothetical protein DRP71_06690 [Verrucomicrobia bacterium]|nr:MAG: hypothetical protein DRP71_06690 [Verrucomicrobiota bacterium]
MADDTLMYQRGKITPGSRATVMTVAFLLTAAVFLLVPFFVQVKLVFRSGVGGFSPVATAPSVGDHSLPKASSSIEPSRLELSVWESVPIGWTPKPRSVLKVPQAFETPVLEKFEVSEEARVQFVFNVDDLDFTPSPLYRKRPIYPYQLRQENIEGRVTAEFRVDCDGHTYDIRITDSDHPEFAASVVEALLSWRFVPGLVDGEPVEFRMRIPMLFRIVTSQPADPDLFIASVD